MTTTILHKGIRHHYFTLTTLREVGTSAVCAAMSAHWMKKVTPEPLVWLLDGMRVTYKDPTIYFELRNGDTLAVMQAGLHIGTLSTYTPKGDVRGAVQAEVASSKINNKKSPHNSKRSSSRPKAEKMVELLNYMTLEEYIRAQFFSRGFFRASVKGLINQSVPLEESELNNFTSKIYFGNNFGLLERIMRNKTTLEDKEAILNYLQVYDRVQDQRMERSLLQNVWVSLQILPPGGVYFYRMITYQPTTDSDGNDVPGNVTLRDFPSIDDLPDVIQSKLALLQLGSDTEAKMVGGMQEADCDWLLRYYFIGEDLGELLDTGRESKEGGGGLSE